MEIITKVLKKGKSSQQGLSVIDGVRSGNENLDGTWRMSDISYIK
jgi:hypothetical protein